jgi:hypothetical protein
LTSDDSSGSDKAENQSTGDIETLRQYAFVALGRWNDLEKSMTRLAGFMLLTALIFELINRGTLQEVDIGVVKVTDVRFISVALPVIMAYLEAYSASRLTASGVSNRTTIRFARELGYHTQLSQKRTVERVLYHRLLP